MEAIGDVIDKIVKKRNLGDQNKLTQEVLADPEVRKFLKEHKDKVDKAMILASITNLYEFHTQIHKPDEIMQGYRPELFINGKVIDVRYAPTDEKLARNHELEVKNNLRLVNLPNRLYGVKLSEVDKTNERAVALMEILKFLQAFKKDPHQRGLYLSGDFGVGKTYILAGLANNIANSNKTVVFLHVPTFIANLSRHISDNSLSDEMDRLIKCDVLILDDIGAETLSQWSRDDVLGVILQARMDNVMPTFFSSNFSMNELEAHFAETKNSIDEVKAARLMQRVRFLAKEITISGPNKRILEN
ncbi:primosomal protein DnaI [Lactobacillus pasteurii DSM 23907 = CRBIP 24.76]|uniref:Primosomal protein DnaI n=1 Tax=Lactobacillus pasteurii DSM 23907 = CRBIP 24.76 TaxID=1423790 RepID=I7JYS1_9LACO|nr:primosomal protein DnaI [Lactobacillus pasteurii]KRK08343.1 primosomal protein DnaI [Lactobacillus pasteurii DSM 23907 = CRBIP 24.76]TDG75521.1 hypothetical protein C5L33_000406 [Lactobacillus pasteurii]CCI85800.1 Primosomal protein DnaI [Lactobacillus pasteurii DSM 23907 = CRBIP 24.76]